MITQRIRRISILFLLLFLSEYSIAQQKNCPQPEDSLFKPYYSEKALVKVKDLGYAINLITDKESDPIDANTAIDNAVKLFVNEDATVEVTSIKDTTTKRKFKIRDYLKRLKALKYDKVEISWTSVNYVSDLREGDDGKYHGVVSYQQMFTGFLDGRIVYKDWVKKNVEIVVATKEVQDTGKTLKCWDVFLSDIQVIETRDATKR